MLQNMDKLRLALPLGAIAGTIIGIMIGSTWLHWQLHGDPNSANVFGLITDFPGFRTALSDPWRTAYMIVIVGAILVTAIALFVAFTTQLTQYGKARFQTRRDMRKNRLLQPIGSGLVFGKLGKPGSTAKFVSADYDKFPHCLVVAPTRAGKGVGYVIPNTLLFPGSCVVLDVKGEIFEATARHRQAQGDKVFRFAPFDFEHSSHRYNPLERIAALKNTDQRYTELSKLATYFLVTKGEKDGAQGFIDGARQLFVAGGMLAIERGKPTIGEVTRILMGGGDKPKAYRDAAAEIAHPQSATIFREFAEYADRTLSSYVSVLNSAGLGLWLNPKIDKVTSASDFSWTNIRKTPQSVYLVVNSDDIETLAPLLRLIFGEFIATMRATIPDPKLEPWPVLAVIDEFDQLGRMIILVQALKQLAGHGVRVSLITQSIPGLDEIYGENNRISIEANSGMKLFLSPNEKKTAGEVSEALGKTTRVAVSDSFSPAGDGGHFRRTVSRRSEERPLLTPDEVRKLNPNEVILIPERQNPLRVKRIVYFEDPYFQAISKAQTGPLPYPDETTSISEVRSQVEDLTRMVSELSAVAQLRFAPESAIWAQPAHVRPSPAVARKLVEKVEAEPEKEPDEAVAARFAPPSDEVKAAVGSFREKLAKRA